jgi:hypothetical protein
MPLYADDMARHATLSATIAVVSDATQKVAGLAGVLVAYVTYLIIERWVGGVIAADAAGAIGFGACVWILRKAD